MSAAAWKLTPQAKQFCFEYTKSGSTYDAAIAAGFTESTARVKAPGWLKRSTYIAEINRLRGIVTEVINNELRQPVKKRTTTKKSSPKPTSRSKPNTQQDADSIAIDEQARLHALTIAKAAKSVQVDKNWIMEQFVQQYLRATDPKRPNLAAANTALEKLGIELGMFVRKSAVEWRDVTALTPEEVSAATSKALEELGNNIPPELLKLMSAHMGTVQ